MRQLLTKDGQGIIAETAVVIPAGEGQVFGREVTMTYGVGVEILSLGLGVTRRELEREGCDLNDYVLPAAYAEGFRYVAWDEYTGI